MGIAAARVAMGALGACTRSLHRHGACVQRPMLLLLLLLLLRLLRRDIIGAHVHAIVRGRVAAAVVVGHRLRLVVERALQLERYFNTEHRVAFDDELAQVEAYTRGDGVLGVEQHERFERQLVALVVRQALATPVTQHVLLDML